MAKSKSTKGKHKVGAGKQGRSSASAAVSKADKSSSAKTAQLDPDDFAFGRINYIIMIGGLLLIIIGYAFMAGGKSSTPEEFNPEIFSFQRITLAPLLVLAGLVVQVWAIVKKAD